MVAPSQLHGALEKSVGVDPDTRIEIMRGILRSDNLAVIRRIPDLLRPLTEDEKAAVVQWVGNFSRDEEGSKRDFAFHLMVNCEVPAEIIISILEEKRVFTRTVLEHIQQVLRADGSIERLDSYLAGVAGTLLLEDRVPSRDRGRHMLMTLAKTAPDWEILAERFSVVDIADLRQQVIERFLSECPEGDELTYFAQNVAGMCLASVRAAKPEDVHKEASHMHWTLTCLSRLNRKDDFRAACRLFAAKFGNSIPQSVRWRFDQMRPTSDTTTRVAVRPSSIEGALADGWTIRKESGRQVILVKDRQSVTLYR